MPTHYTINKELVVFFIKLFMNHSLTNNQNLTANKKADGFCDQTIVEVISLSFSSSGRFPWENFIPIDRLLLFSEKINRKKFGLHVTICCFCNLHPGFFVATIRVS